MSRTRTDGVVGRLLAAADGLLIDVDGTLVDSSAPVRRVWTAFADRHGADPEAVLRAASGRPSRETVRRFAPPAEHAREAELLERGELDDPAGIRALPGAAELLASGSPLVVVTSCSRALMRVRLGAAGLPIPKLAVTADDVVHGKPDPECFLRGAAALRLAPKRCLVIEDSPAGVAAARAAGSPVVAVRTTHPDVQLADADAIVDTPADLLAR
ncbi:MAG: HAD-IA family hydrolase [Solirubrobacterales bacterium]|nr:HAD-IA family hydrolase [Solirubrobacterales bacterium]